MPDALERYSEVADALCLGGKTKEEKVGVRSVHAWCLLCLYAGPAFVTGGSHSMKSWRHIVLQCYGLSFLYSFCICLRSSNDWCDN